MRVSTTDPISLVDIKNPDLCPYIVEGSGQSAMKIYFESEANKQAYLELAVEHPGKDFTYNLDNPA